MIAAVDAAGLEALRAQLARQPLVTIDTDVTRTRRIELTSRHGLFSARGLDEGTALLLGELASLPPVESALDLGCGYGAIGLTLAARWPGCSVDLVDTDIRAVEAAAENAARNRLGNATAALSDGIRELSNGIGAYDLVAANLPAQAGNGALDQLLLDAHDALKAEGLLAVVAVNGLRRLPPAPAGRHLRRGAGAQGSAGAAAHGAGVGETGRVNDM